MSNIKTLIAVNHNAYSALKNQNDIEAKIGNYEFIGYKRDMKSDHGGIAYYNPEDKSVIIAHRGSATLKDWLNHNPKIALEVIGKPIETMADVSGKRFTNQILEQLDKQGNEIGLIIQSGHSLGGRISQSSLIEITENLNLEAKSLTFNSAPIKNPTERNYKEDHINLKLSGGSIYNTDLVSSFGTQLGENYKVISDKIGNPITAHSLKSFAHIERESNQFVSDDLAKIFKHVKDGKLYADYPKDLLSVDKYFEEEKTKTIYSLDSNSAGDKSKVIQNDADRGTTVSLVSTYDKAMEKITGNEAGEDGKLKSVAREMLTFDKVDGAKILAWNTIDHVAGSGAISTAVKTGIVAHEIVKGSEAIGKGINSDSENKKSDDNNEKQTFHNVDYNDLKLVRVVKDIDNFKTDRDNLIIGHNPNKGESIRNTIHFTLNTVVQDHANSKGQFSESKYAIVADLKETADNNKIHGLSPVDTFFWGDNLKVKQPTIFMPAGDQKIDQYSNQFEVIQYPKGDTKEENYKNLSVAVEDYFNKKELPFKEASLWNWSGQGITPDEEQKRLSQHLGSAEMLPKSHDSSLDQKIESANASLVVIQQDLEKLKSEDDAKKLSYSIGHEIDESKKYINELLNEIKEINPHSLEHYSLVQNRHNNLETEWKEKLDSFYKDENLTIAVPPPLPTDQEWKEYLKSVETNNIEHFCSSPEINNAVDKHFISDGENKERKFFMSQEDALKFYQENYKEIDQTIDMQKNILGYSTKEDFLKESSYFSDFEKENIEKTLNNQANDQQKEIQASLAGYALDSTIYDRQFFEDMQKDIQQDYAKSEVYIFLSDSDSQTVVYRSDMFMDDQKHEMQVELDTKVFDRVDQVEDHLEANEALLQQKFNRLNVVDNRANPQALAVKGMLQNKLNNVRGDLAELKPFHSVTATPLGTDKNNVILVDTKSDNLYSVSKNKIVGTDIDLDDILKNHKTIELFNNGNKIDTKLLDNTLNNHLDNDKVKSKSSERSLDLDI